MKTKNKSKDDFTGREFVIKREFNAPRELVFHAWAEPHHIAAWWGPRGFSNPVCQWDPQTGRAIHVVMRAPNGVDYPMGGEFRECKFPERLVFTCGPLNERGEMMFEFLHTAEFAEQGEKTLLTLRSVVLWATPEAGRYIGGFEAGMTQSLERLAGVLSAEAGPLVVERTLDAPVALVWDVLTKSGHIKEWSFDIKEFKPEAGFEFQMVAEKNGVKYDHRCKVTEAVPHKKLAYTWRYEGYPGDSLVAFELFAVGEKTRVRLTHEGLGNFPKIPAFARKNFIFGWTWIVGESLRKYVEGQSADGREIVITRAFEVPRELVWQAMTDPKHVIHWWGPNGFTTTIEEMDVRPGGIWKHVMHGPDGTDYPNRSIFREVEKPGRISFVHAGKKEGGSGANFVATWTFDEEAAGKTRVTIRMVFPSAAERDTVVKVYGAIEGGKQTLERLAGHLPKMTPAKQA